MPTLQVRSLVLISGSLLSLVLGSVHSFSVFLEPLEQAFGSTRSAVSLTYSLALVALTIAVLVGHHIFSRIQASWLTILVCLTGAAGALVAAKASTFWQLWIGYSLLFGGANGFGYAFALQMSAQASPGREGVAMGIITACYAIGSMISPPLFVWAMSLGGYQWAMLGLSAVLILIAPICAILFAKSAIQFQTTASEHSKRIISQIQTIWMWVGYGTGVAAGLMAIGHATGIAKSAGLQHDTWIAPVTIAIFNMIGSIAGGWLADRTRHTILLSGLSLISATTLLLLAYANNSAVSLLALGTIGLTYGAFIAAFPASISKAYGVFKGTRIYGRVFTAWGTAGLLAPWLSGYLFDQTGNYSAALLTGAVLAVLSATVIISKFSYEVLSNA